MSGHVHTAHAPFNAHKTLRLLACNRIFLIHYFNSRWKNSSEQSDLLIPIADIIRRPGHLLWMWRVYRLCNHTCRVSNPTHSKAWVEVGVSSHYQPYPWTPALYYMTSLGGPHPLLMQGYTSLILDVSTLLTSSIRPHPLYGA